jgi:glycolate oxidase iron-sulfur subunit
LVFCDDYFIHWKSMQTALADFIRDSARGQRADRILRACVHCGFCTATCPTYQLLGDELDGPRGRIYQIKQVLEGEPPTPTLQAHLDRCLTCRSCETTCPSGVDYHLLLDIGREVVEELQPRPLGQRLQRKAMVWLFSDARRFAPLMVLARAARPLLPASLRQKIMPRPQTVTIPQAVASRRMLLLDGCVQPVLAPQINQALQLILGRLGIALQSAAGAGCCGALPQHLSEAERAREMARRNIDAWWPLLEQGAEAVVITASGCTAQVRDYPHLLEDEPAYAEKARRLADRAKDPVEILLDENLEALDIRPRGQRVAVHTPCTQQHGLGLDGAVARLLSGLGYRLTAVAENHLCCGSAGTYSLTQPKLSQRLRVRKLEALNIDRPDRIVTANIGCLGHLQDEEGTPVCHWLDLLAEDLRP